MNLVSSVLLSFTITLGCIISASSAFSDGVAKTSTANQAKAVELTAHQVVEKTTERVMKLITEARGYYDDDPEKFYVEIETILNEVVDFDSFARGVMGKYANLSSYRALKSEEEKQQFRARAKRFSSVFRDGLVQTYAKGLLALNGNKIEILPPEEHVDTVASPRKSNSVTVVQHIYGNSEKPFVVNYKLRKDKRGQWKLRNLTIEAINLGKVYQSQFSSAAKQYNGDIDKVIDNWSVDPTDSSSDSNHSDDRKAT